MDSILPALREDGFTVSTTYLPNKNADFGRSQMTLSDDISEYSVPTFSMAGEQKRLIKNTPPSRIWEFLTLALPSGSIKKGTVVDCNALFHPLSMDH